MSLVVGLIQLYENQPKTLSKILSFVSSDAFQNDGNVKREIDVRGIDLTLLIFRQLFSANEKVRSVVFEEIKKISKISGTSPLVSLVSKLNLNPEGSLEKLFAQINGLTDFDILSYLMNKLFEFKVYREPELITIVLILGTSILENFRSKDKGIILAQNLIALTVLAAERCKTASDENADVTNPKLVEVSDKSVDLVSTANKKKAIPAKVLEKICGALKSLPKFCSDPQSQLESCIQILVLGSSLKAAGLDLASEKTFEIFGGKDQLLLAKISALKMPKQIFTTKNVEMEPGKLESLFSLAQLHCSKEISTNLEKDKLAAILPYLLTALTTDNKKVRKTTFKSFEQVLGQTSKKVKSAAFLPLLQHLVDHKAEIVSNVVNLSDVLAEFSGVESNEEVLNNLLGMIIGCETTRVFTQVNICFFYN